MAPNNSKVEVEKKEKLEGRPVQPLANSERRMEGITEEEGLENKRMAKKIAKKWKRVLRKHSKSLSQ